LAANLGRGGEGGDSLDGLEGNGSSDGPCRDSGEHGLCMYLLFTRDGLMARREGNETNTGRVERWRERRGGR